MKRLVTPRPSSRAQINLRLARTDFADCILDVRPRRRIEILLAKWRRIGLERVAGNQARLPARRMSVHTVPSC